MARDSRREMELPDWVSAPRNKKKVIAKQLGISRKHLDTTLESDRNIWVIIFGGEIVDAYEYRGKVRVFRFKDD